MCGICGFAGNFEARQLKSANQWQAHRGPDDAGEYFDLKNGVGLGHTRLSILDLSVLGHQPMVSDDGSVVLVFNGEIYNFRELRAELRAKGFAFRGHSDTEVLLNCYLAEGEAMLPRLNGIFAIALWDRRNQSLLVARDALGVKPLYYSAIDGRFAFASEIKALLQLVPECRELDSAALHRYLSFLWCPGEGTPLKAVRKVLPGEAIVVRENKIVHRWQWYQLPLVRGRTADVTNPDLAIMGVTECLRTAVHRQLVADVPVGAFLSGGLDSSAVVAMARERNPDIQCFTIRNSGGQDAGFNDDLPYAQRVAKHLGVPLDIVDVSALDIARDLQQMVAQLDEPLIDTAPLNVLYISELARRHGIKVLLSGAGGDDVFTGYRRHVAMNYDHLWRWLPAAVRSWLDRTSAGLDQRKPLMRRLGKFFNGAALTGDPRLVNYFLWVRENQLRDLYTPEFLHSLNLQEAATPMLDFLASVPSTVPPLARMLALEQRFFLADFNLLFTDKMSMAVGVEVRVPYLDLELVDYVSRIPVSMLQHGVTGKWILKEAMKPYLPTDVIYRPKTGFGGPLRRWVRFELRELLGDLLSRDSLVRRGLFDPSAVQRLIAANDAGKIDASYTLLSLMCIEIWCRSFLDESGFSRKQVAGF